jgi:hypothetical protein
MGVVVVVCTVDAMMFLVLWTARRSAVDARIDAFGALLVRLSM